MNKKTFFFFTILVLSIGAATVYHFFVLTIVVSNRSSNIPEANISCRANSGEFWKFDKLKEGSTDKKLLMLSSGSAVICTVDIQGYEKVSSVVIGYFDENMADIHISLDDSHEGIVMNVYEISSGRTTKVDDKIFSRTDVQIGDFEK